MKHEKAEKEDFLTRHVMEICYLGMVAAALVRTIPPFEELGDFWRSYILSYYALSYQTAGMFVARGLVGAVTQLLCRFVAARPYYFVFWLLYLAFYSFLGLCVIRHIKRKENAELYFLLLCVCVFNPAMLNYAVDFARPDIFLVLLVMLGLRLTESDAGVLLLPAVAIIGMLIHEGFIILFVPMMATVLLKKWVERKKARYLIVFIAFCLSSLLLFIVVLKYGKGCVADIDQLHAAAQSRVEIALNPNMIDFEQGAMREQLSDISLQELQNRATVLKLFFYVLLFVPLLWGYFRVMVHDACRPQSRLLRFLSLLAPLSGLLMILAGVDYGRWFSMMITCCLLRAYCCVRENDFELNELLCIRNGRIFFVWALALLACYITIGTMGDIDDHFPYLNNLCSLCLYVRDAVLQSPPQF